MVAWQELHIQSNIPLIVLAISLLCIAIIGFLEFKKMSYRVNEITIELEQMKLTKNKEVKTFEEKGLAKGLAKGEAKGLAKGEAKGEAGGKWVDEGETLQPPMDERDLMMQMRMPEQGISDMIMGGMLDPENMMSGGIVIGGPMMPMMPMRQMMPMGDTRMHSVADGGEELEEVVDDKLSECSLEDDKMKDLENNDNEFSEEESGGSEESEESESESESESEEDGEVDGIELIQGKGKVEEVKEVNRSLSIKELKDICQTMDLSTSGNKETLIKRINSRK